MAVLNLLKGVVIIISTKQLVRLGDRKVLHSRSDWNVTAVDHFPPEVEGVGVLWPVHVRCWLSYS